MCIHPNYFSKVYYSLLGDNIFYGSGLSSKFSAIRNISEAHILGYRVANPSDYGIIEIDSDGNPIRIVEKPKKPSSNIAVTGLYFYPGDAAVYAKSLLPSSRGELEITDLNNKYLEQSRLTISLLERGSVWFDTGTFESMHAASEFVRTIEVRQGTKIACPEEVAIRMAFLELRDIIDRAKFGLSADLIDYLGEIK
jgi:glucose-1-phosphate thymidylyltransferase